MNRTVSANRILKKKMPVSCSRQALSLYEQGVLSCLALNKGYHINKTQ